MFGKAKRIAELEEQLKKIQEELDSTKQLLQNSTDELKAVTEERDNAVRSIDEKAETFAKAEKECSDLKEIYQKKILDFEEKRDEQDRTLVHEAAIAREELAEELSAKKQESFNQISEKLSLFASNYENYISRIGQLVQALNTAASSSFRDFLLSDNIPDVKGYFEHEMQAVIGPAEKCADEETECSAPECEESAPEAVEEPSDEAGEEPSPEFSADIEKAVSAIKDAIDDLNNPDEDVQPEQQAE